MDRAHGLPPVAVGVALSLAIVGGVLSSLWPMAAAPTAAVGVTLFLCFRAPAYAFLAALLLYSFEGSIKMRLSVEEVPSPLGVGAALLDLAFLASLVAVLVQDRGRSLLRVWNAATRSGAGGGHRPRGLVVPIGAADPRGRGPDERAGGLPPHPRCTFPAALGGVVVAARLGADRLAPLLLGSRVLLATSYAAGPRHRRALLQRAGLRPAAHATTPRSARSAET